MALYHLYYLKRGMLVGSSDIEASDDDEAARIAGNEAKGQAVEIWNDHQRICVLTSTPEVYA